MLHIAGAVLLSAGLLLTPAQSRAEDWRIGALFPLFTVGLSVALVNDRLSREQTVGVAAAFAGIALIASSA